MNRSTSIRTIHRRRFLHRLGGGLGLLALHDLLAAEERSSRASAAQATIGSRTTRQPHAPPRARAVIHLFMYGGPSQVDLFDPKPELQRRDGQPLPGSEVPDVFFGRPGPLLASPFRFHRHGQSGQWVSELLPHLSEVIDEIAVIRSMRSDSNNHAPALFQMNTGRIRPGHPCLGSWAIYGLGSENANLPGFVVLCDRRGGPIGGPPNWSAGYMPASYQGVPFRPDGPPILDLAPPPGIDRRTQQAKLDLLRGLNEVHQDSHPGDVELAARMDAYELAFRMQSEAPEAVDLSRESEETTRLYGLDDPVCAPFGRQLLIARRLVERGVRFVQIFSGGGGGFVDNWDAHEDLATNHRQRCAETDRPTAGLLVDLKRRGLLDETLVLWGGEFGRMPISQAKIGRDHNPHGFTVWMAGGGVAGGRSYGATDDFGYRAVENPVHVHDWHATILDLLGLDHTRLTFFHNGRDMRLTDVAGEPIRAILG